MKIPILLCVLLVGAVAASAQPADAPAKLVNDLPFPLVAPERAQELALTKPIVLNFNDAKLGEVLAELQKQSGVKFGTAQANNAGQLDTKISININTLSFDRAFHEIMDEAGLKARLQDWGEQNLQLTFGSEETEQKPLKSGVGLFEIDLSAIGTTFNKSVDLSNFETPNRSENRDLNASLALKSDARLPLIGTPQARLTRADDEQGRSLLPQLDENERAQRRINRYNFYGNSSWQQKQATLNLRPPAPDAKMLSHLEGVVIYPVVTKTETWEVPDLLAAPDWTRSMASGGETIAFKVAATPNTETDEGGLKVKIEANSSDADQSYERIPYPLGQVEPLIAMILIEDSNGVVLRPNGYNASGGQNTVIRATFLPENWQFQNEGERPKLQGPFRFVLDAPVEIVQTEVPFAFENVPLP